MCCQFHCFRICTLFECRVNTDAWWLNVVVVVVRLYSRLTLQGHSRGSSLVSTLLVICTDWYLYLSWTAHSSPSTNTSWDYWSPPTTWFNVLTLTPTPCVHLACNISGAPSLHIFPQSMSYDVRGFARVTLQPSFSFSFRTVRTSLSFVFLVGLSLSFLWLSLSSLVQPCFAVCGRLFLGFIGSVLLCFVRHAVPK